LTISSPLEAHKSHTLVYDTCSVDVGYENPLFAVLEVDYGDTDQQDSTINTGEYEKILTFYEMDLGLNHVIRKQAETLPKSAHLLIPGFTAFLKFINEHFKLSNIFSKLILNFK